MASLPRHGVAGTSRPASDVLTLSMASRFERSDQTKRGNVFDIPQYLLVYVGSLRAELRRIHSRVWHQGRPCDRSCGKGRDGPTTRGIISSTKHEG